MKVDFKDMSPSGDVSRIWFVEWADSVDHSRDEAQWKFSSWHLSESEAEEHLKDSPVVVYRTRCFEYHE